MIKKFQRSVLTWYKKHGRKNLPWQRYHSAYHTWLSEIMLQQTQVETVIPYFERFIKKFPTIEKLASAELDDILSLWAGLGYYARARNLHRCAKLIVEQYQGKFPTTLKELQTLPGIGRSTAGAILSLAFNQPAPILDGNVKRVLARAHAITGFITERAVLNELWLLAEQYVPKNDAASYTQAMMDLGAMICTRTKPTCNECPLNKLCQAHIKGLETTLPRKKTKKSLPIRKTYMLILQNAQHEILLEKRPPVGIWGGLWSFPECHHENEIKPFCKEHYACQIKTCQTRPTFRHTFSHFHLDITPIFAKIEHLDDQILEAKTVIWHNAKKLLTLGIPKPIKHLLKEHIT